MITELPKEDLIQAGERFRADYLVEQAGYTLGVAALDGKALEELLPDGFMKEVQDALAAVNAARQDRALMVSESGASATSQHGAVKQAKVWRRKVAKRASGAAHRGKEIPDKLLTVSKARTTPELLAQVVEMTKLLEATLPKLHGAGTDQLLQEGKQLCDLLQSADASHQVKRLKELPDAVKAFYVQKALLYYGLKVINDGGQGLFADSPSKASAYNLSILHRHTGKAAPDQPETPPAAPKA